MKLFISGTNLFSISLLLIVCLLIFSNVEAKEQKNDKWEGKLIDGSIIFSKDLHNILDDHLKWLESNLSSSSKEGKKADLRGANLSGANLSGANLKSAHLSRANLHNANLEEADLSGADLINSDLSGANLYHANLAVANLSEANLKSANLKNTNMRDANLSGAKLFDANLELAYLSGANLNGANLGGANLHDANLEDVTLRGASLNSANLSGAMLQRANLSGASLNVANLNGVDFSDANLSGAFLHRADLRGVIFEVLPNSFPNLPSIANAINLSSMTFSSSPRSLIELRTAFKHFGLREKEREITYAIRSTERATLARKSGWKKIESYFLLIMFELTCDYGMTPQRPLFILIYLIPVFSIFYIISLLKQRGHKNGRSGIWIVWAPDRMRKDIGTDSASLLSVRGIIRTCLHGCYFSLLSAFHIGWREVNVGNWIARIQPKEYTLRASGLVRTISGIQSIISVYLLALSVLTYFGRPFE